MLVSPSQASSTYVSNESTVDDGLVHGSGRIDRDILLNSYDLPRPGFLAGEVFAVDIHIKRFQTKVL